MPRSYAPYPRDCLHHPHVALPAPLLNGAMSQEHKAIAHIANLDFPCSVVTALSLASKAHSASPPESNLNFYLDLSNSEFYIVAKERIRTILRR